jgi:hypothetical protein
MLIGKPRIKKRSDLYKGNRCSTYIYIINNYGTNNMKGGDSY